MSRGFIEVGGREPHIGRMRRIRRAHPSVKSLYGRNPYTALIALALVLFQGGTAASLALFEAPWWLVLAAAWCLGAFAAHALFVVMHEASHRLVFGAPRLDRSLLIAANLPLMAPFAIPFAHFHLLHHRAQGQLGRDPDLPAPWEARLFGGPWLGKWAWHLFFPLIQLFRAGDAPDEGLSWRDPWWLANIATQATASLTILWLSPTAFLYLTASLYFVFALHPLSGRFVQEHFVVSGHQETNSYYGPLNLVSLNFGYHTEHHDFPAIPWHRLPRLRTLAIRHYEDRHHHTSWGRLWLRLLFDPDLRITDRAIRSDVETRRASPDERPQEMPVAGDEGHRITDVRPEEFEQDGAAAL